MRTQVHAYVAAPGERTAYLAELASGAEVLVADARGRSRSALVGRIKVERRPLVRGHLSLPDPGPICVCPRPPAALDDVLRGALPCSGP